MSIPFLGYAVTEESLYAAAPELFLAAIQAIEAVEINGSLKGKDDDCIYNELGSDAAGAYFALRSAVRKAAGGCA